jgi:hypothetical protein
MLVRGLTWLKHDDLKEYLRGKARWPVGGLLKQARDQLQMTLNRELAPGVRLSGSPAEIAVIGVHAGSDAVRVRAHAMGTCDWTCAEQRTPHASPTVRPPIAQPRGLFPYWTLHAFDHVRA